MSAVTFNENKIILDTRLTEDQFSKAKFSDRLNEKGTLVTVNENQFTFSHWQFTNTTLTSFSTIGLEGETKKGKTLSELISLEEKDALTVYKINLVCRAIEAAVKEKIYLPENGAGGIYISDDCSEIIFLPHLFFKMSCSFFDEKEYSEEQGFYVNENLTGYSALKFIQAAIYYKLLSEEFPFTAINQTERQKNIGDRNFIPVEYQVKGLNKNVSHALNTNLSQKALTEHTYKKVELSDYIFIDEKEINLALGLEENGSLPSSKKLNEAKRDSIDEEKFLKEKEKKLNAIDKRVGSTRTFRKYKSLLFTIIVALVFVAGVILGVYYKKQNNPSSIGLTSEETVQMFYSAVNRLDVLQATKCSKGRTMDKYTTILGNIYVTSKARSMYDPQEMSQPVAKWFCLNQTKFNLCGISNFEIEDTDFIPDIYFIAPKKKGCKMLTEENGAVLHNGDTKNFTVHYYLVLTEGINEITIEPTTEKLTLTYRKNAWYITDIKTEKTSHKVNASEFISIYENAKEYYGLYLTHFQEEMKLHYDFTPTLKELKDAQKFIENEPEEKPQKFLRLRP